MILQFFFFTQLFKYLNAANAIGNDFPDSMTPSLETIEIYDRERAKIFLHVKIETSTRTSLVRVIIVKNDLKEFMKSMENLLQKLHKTELLKAMLFDKSDQFLFLFWFTLPDLGKELFNPFLDPHFSKEIFPAGLRIIFNNFIVFLSQWISELKSTDNQAGFNLSCLSQILWHRRLWPFWKKILFNSDLVKYEIQIKRKLYFFHIFLANDCESLLISEYVRLCKDIRKGESKVTSAVQNFSLLSKHFGNLLKDINSSEFLSRFHWLATQSPLFLLYFFYFLKQSLEGDYEIWHLFNEGHNTMKLSVDSYLELNGSKCLIFGNFISNSFDKYQEVIWLAQRIIHKIETLPNEIYDK